MIVPTEINRNLVTDGTDSDNVPIFAANDAGDACPGKEGVSYSWKLGRTWGCPWMTRAAAVEFLLLFLRGASAI